MFIATQIMLYTLLFASLYFEVFLLLTFLERGAHHREKTMPKRVKDAALPRVAIVVPCFNEGTTVAGTLTSLLALDYPKHKCEIIAVNDGSTDNTADVLAEFASHKQIHIFHKENGGKHSAMNYALAHTDAEFIGCLDADSFVTPDALRRIIRHFSNPEVASVTPNIRIHEPRTIVQRLQSAEYGLSSFIRKAFTLLDALFVTPGPFSFFRRSAILAVGPWRPAHLTEDLEMGLRLQAAGYKIENEPLAITHTSSPKTLRALWKQRVRWVYGFVCNLYDYRHLMFDRSYGSLGMVILPVSAFSIFSALVVAFMTVFYIVVSGYEQFERVTAIGGMPTIAIQTFDLFFLSTAALSFIAIAVMSLTVLLIAFGKHIGGERALHWDIPIYLVLYGLIAPFWLSMAVWKAVTGTRVRWR